MTEKTLSFIFYLWFYGLCLDQVKQLNTTHEIIVKLSEDLFVLHARFSEVGFMFRNCSAQFFKPHPNTTARLARVKVNYGNSLYHSQSAPGQHLGENEFCRGAAQDLKNFSIMSVQYILAYFSTFSEPKSV